MWRRKQIFIKALCLSLLTVLAPAPHAFSAQSNSTNYQVNEVYFGSGGQLQACSTSYCSKQSAGETAVGNTKSTNYQAQAGFNTDRTPYIECIVNSQNIDLGVLTAGTTATATAAFSVKSYLSSGYIVQTVSDPPKSGSNTLTPLGSAVASNSGSEQFGINLVANTSPVTFGADPVQSPDNTFGFGQVASGYNTTNLYKYAKGDTIAYSNSSSGTTNYTISYIFNTTNLTPSGQYTMKHVLVATATF